MIRKALGTAVLVVMAWLLSAPGSALEPPEPPSTRPTAPVTVASPPWTESPGAGALEESGEDNRNVALAVAVVGVTLLLGTLVMLTRRPGELVFVPARVNVEGRRLAEASVPMRDLHEVRR